MAEMVGYLTEQEQKEWVRGYPYSMAFTQSVVHALSQSRVQAARLEVANAALAAALPLIVFAVQFELGEGDVTWERCHKVWTETVLPSLDKEHDGDCVKEPQVCFRCQAEECIRVAGLIRAALDALKVK